MLVLKLYSDLLAQLLYYYSINKNSRESKVQSYRAKALTFRKPLICSPAPKGEVKNGGDQRM